MHPLGCVYLNASERMGCAGSALVFHGGEGSDAMNRLILVLNVIVLVVTFVLALSATNSQIGLTRSASEIANYPRAARSTAWATPGASLAYLRVVQSLAGTAPRSSRKLTARKGDLRRRPGLPRDGQRGGVPDSL